MGWGSEAVPVPIAADRDCGCWKPEKPEVVVTQELSERLSEAVKAEAVWRVTDRHTLPWRPKQQVQQSRAGRIWGSLRERTRKHGASKLAEFAPHSSG